MDEECMDQERAQRILRWSEVTCKRIPYDLRIRLEVKMEEASLTHTYWPAFGFDSVRYTCILSFKISLIAQGSNCCRKTHYNGHIQLINSGGNIVYRATRDSHLESLAVHGR